MVDVLDPLTIHQLLKSIPKNPWDSDQVSQMVRLTVERSQETLVYRKATVRYVYMQATSLSSLSTCDHCWLLSKEYLTYLHKFCVSQQTTIFAEHFGAKKVIILRRTVQNLSCAVCATLCGCFCNTLYMYSICSFQSSEITSRVTYDRKMRLLFWLAALITLAICNEWLGPWRHLYDDLSVDVCCPVYAIADGVMVDRQH